MIAVVDAGVALKWFFNERTDEPHADRAVAVLRDVGAGRSRMIQPPHFLAKVAAVLARKAPETARENLFDLQLLEWESVESPAIHATAIDLSIDLRRHLFDALYHATAMHTEGATLTRAGIPATRLCPRNPGSGYCRAPNAPPTPRRCSAGRYPRREAGPPIQSV